MVTRAIFVMCIVVAFLHEATSTKDDAHKDPYHQRPEIFKPITERTTAEPVEIKTTVKPVTERTTVQPVTERSTVKPVMERTTVKPVEERTTTKPVETTTCTNINTECLPQGPMSRMLCWESFDFAYCAHRIIQSNPCNKGKLWMAQSVLSTLQNGGEFTRCGYYLDSKCEIGFCFDQTRLDLVPCYMLYFYDPVPTDFRSCIAIGQCLEYERPGYFCDFRATILSCAADGVTKDYCRQDYGRRSLTIWKTYQELGEFERCNMGLNPEDNSVELRRPNIAHPMCYNLSGTLTLSYSTNKQQTSYLKGYSVILVVLVIIPFSLTFL